MVFKVDRILMAAALAVTAALPMTAWAQKAAQVAEPISTHTLQEALAAAYSNTPSLQAARATLRATDESVPTALAGWRPTVTTSANMGPSYGNTISGTQASHVSTKQNRSTAGASLTITQPIYNSGRTQAAVNKAQNSVIAARAKLIASEEQLFSDSVNAYVSVISATDLLALNVNNEQVLQRQLQATNDRFRVGEITRTDVAQAQAALAGATATRQTAEGSLQTARSNYQRLIGDLPEKLVAPQPLKLPTRTLEEAKALAAANNPSVIAAMFQNAADKDNFDQQYAALLPTASIQATDAYSQNVSQKNYKTDGGTILAVLTVPLYQGGSEYAAIRAARQTEQSSARLIEDARRTAVQLAISAWETYQAAKSTIASTRTQIRANEVALEGTQREAIVGSRTTLDVLNAEQTLLNSRTTLVQNLSALVTASYGVANAVGRLTARDLNLQVPLYDETAYYEAVKNRWVGTSDQATEQPGR